MEKSEVRVLIIDDESTIRNILKAGLDGHGFRTMTAGDGQSGLQKISEFHPHLVVLDLGLPDMGGLQVLQALRKWSQVPVIVLTVKDDEKTKVNLLDSGADDYLTKPFGLPELLARIRVTLRHTGFIEATPIFQSGDLEVDLNQHLVRVAGQTVKLTNTEFQLLSVLIRDRGKVISQAQLLKQVWGAATEDQSHYLRIYINQLRKKIEPEPSNPRHIITEPGIGYRII
jgi:two-component system, OmpR family, KDP operon response regulator KdpE